jgi:hypothetical protein
VDRDAEIRPISPPYSMVDRAREVNKRTPKRHKNKSRKDQQGEEEKKKKPLHMANEAKERKSLLSKGKDASNCNRNDSQDDSSHEPGEIIDLKI